MPNVTRETTKREVAIVVTPLFRIRIKIRITIMIKQNGVKPVPNAQEEGFRTSLKLFPNLPQLASTASRKMPTPLRITSGELHSGGRKMMVLPMDRVINPNRQQWATT